MLYTLFSKVGVLGIGCLVWFCDLSGEPLGIVPRFLINSWSLCCSLASGLVYYELRVFKGFLVLGWFWWHGGSFALVGDWSKPVGSSCMSYLALCDESPDNHALFEQLEIVFTTRGLKFSILMFIDMNP